MPPHGHGDPAGWAELLLALPIALGLPAYLAAGWLARRRGHSWPIRRYLCWLLGLGVCLVAVTGPLAELATHSFVGHVSVHLLLGMVGPLLLVRAAPVTLALRALPVVSARRLSAVLSSRFVGVLSHPVTAGVGNVAALFALYTTGLYALTGRHLGLHLLMHAHLFLFGYLFAASIVGVDPDRHRASFGVRAAVLVLFAAAHSVLAKQLYATPPVGVSAADARSGAQLLYYGSDAVDLVVMVLLCYHWYVAPNPKGRRRAAGRRVAVPELGSARR